jgi:hypothetical protein
MEPTLPMPHQPESRPANPVTAQQGGEQYVKTENIPSSSVEKMGEMHPVVNPVSAPQSNTVQHLPSPPVATPASDHATQQTTGVPLIADDVDVIEKEWVDKAKKIVSSTKEDPHLQEKQVSELQADYLMKRYNKKIKLSE